MGWRERQGSVVVVGSVLEVEGSEHCCYGPGSGGAWERCSQEVKMAFDDPSTNGPWRGRVWSCLRRWNCPRYMEETLGTRT